MLSLQSDPRQYNNNQVQLQQQQVQQHHHQHHHHPQQQLLQQVAGAVNINNNNNNTNGGGDRRSDLLFSYHNEPVGVLPPSVNVKQEFLSREGIGCFFFYYWEKVLEISWLFDLSIVV